MRRHRDDFACFQGLGEKKFEQFALALHEATAKLSGARFAPDSKQFGIDHIGERLDGSGREVGQSKDYAQFGPAKIRTAADEFLRHWQSEWSDKRIKRFILFVACDVTATLADKEVVTQGNRFAELGVVFELWDAEVIWSRLSSVPGVVRYHLGEDAHRRIFGAPTDHITPLVGAIASRNRDALQASAIMLRLGEKEDSQSAAWRGRVRAGQGTAVAAEILHSIEGPAEETVSAEVRAGQRRLLAGILLSKNDLEAARKWLDAADQLHGHSTRLRAMLLIEEGGPQALLDTFEAEDVEVAEVRAVARLRLGDGAGALQELASFDSYTPRAETLRLRALAHLMKGDRQQAVAAADAAIQADPNLRASRQVAAVCCYYRALSPAVAAMPSDVPQPHDPALARRDDEAVKDLQDAARAFAELARTVPEERDSIRAWQLASLLNARMNAEAQYLIETWFESEEWSPALIVWALSRGLDFDRGRAEAWLSKRVEEHPELGDVMSLLALVSARDDAAGIRAIVNAHGHLMSSAGEHDMLGYWHAVVALDQRRKPDAQTVARLPGLTLRIVAADKKVARRIAKLKTLLADELAGSRSANVVLAAAQMLGDADAWDVATAAAPFLIEEVGTADARTLAARILYYSGQYDIAIEALDRSAYPNANLPYDERRLRGEALQAAGRVVEARTEMQDLALATRNPNDVARAMQVALQQGNIKFARTLFDMFGEKLDAGHIVRLQLATAMVDADPAAAAELVEAAAERLHPKLAGYLFGLANRLDLPVVEAKALRVMASAGGNMLRSASLDEVRDMVLARHEAATQALQQYYRGRIPVHLLAGLSLGGIALRHLAPLVEPPRCGAQTFPLLARYGRRFDDNHWPTRREDVAIRADVTALMTAHCLGLLPRVLATFESVAISASLVSTLSAMHQDLVPTQPARFGAMREVLSHVDTGRLSIGIAHDRVRWLRDHCEGEGDLNLSAWFTVFDGQRQSGDWRLRLGTTVEEAPHGLPPVAGTPIELEHGIAVLFAQAKILDAAMARGPLVISAEEVTHLRSEVGEAHTRTAVAKEVLALRVFVTQGIESGKFRVLPLPARDIKATDPVLQTVEQALAAPIADGEVFWCDDRFMTMFSGVPPIMLSTVEMLELLERFGIAEHGPSDAERQRLRRAHWLFVPLEADEVIRYLRVATRDGQVDETDDLRTLRRAVGKVLLERRIIQWPTPEQFEQGQRGEVDTLLGLGRLTSNVLPRLWGSLDWTVEDAQAASEWLVEHLDVGMYPLSVIGADDPRSDFLMGGHLAGLLTAVIEVPIQFEYDEGRRALLDWAWYSVVEPTLASRPMARPAFLESLQALMLDLLEPDDDLKLRRVILGVAINAFPEELRKLVLGHASLRKAFGISDEPIVGICELEFDARSLYAAMLASRAGAIALADRRGASARVEIQTDSDGQRVCISSGDRNYTLGDRPLRLASDDASVFTAALREYEDVLDLASSEYEHLESELAASAPIERILRMNALVTERPENFYAQLGDDMAARVPFRMHELFPNNPCGPALSLRIAKEDQDLDAAARRLIDERGLGVALRRLSTLPIEPPQSLLDTVAGLDIVTWSEEVARQLGPPLPWRVGFLSAIVGRYPVAADTQKQLDAAVVAAAAPQVRDLTRLWIVGAQFAEKHAPTLTEWAVLSSLQRLALCWYHGGRLAELITQNAIEVKPAIDALLQYRREQPRALVEPITGFDGDRADPSGTTAERALLFMIAQPLVALINGGDDRASKLIEDLLIEKREDGLGARIEVANAGLAASDRLRSVFGRPIDQLLGHLAPGAEILFGSSLAANLLEKAQSAQTSDEQLVVLALARLATGQSRLGGDVEPYVLKAAEGLDLELLPPDAKQAAASNIATLASVNCWSLSSEREAAIERAFAGDTNLSLQAAWLLSHAREVPMARTKALSEKLLHLVGSSEGTDLLPVIRSFCRGLRGQQTEAFVDVLAEIEAGHAAIELMPETATPLL